MIKIEINSKQIKEAIKKLPIRERLKLIEDLERDNWKARFKELLSRIEERVKKNPLTKAQINSIIREAREEYHVRSSS